MPEPTHIVFTYPSQDTEVLFRASDRMLIGERQKGVVIWGENPNAGATDPTRKQSRCFMECEEPLIVPQEPRFPGDEPEPARYKWNRYASQYLRETVTRLDLEKNSVGEPVVIEERCQEGLVVRPPDTMEMAANGGRTPALSMKKLN